MDNNGSPSDNRQFGGLLLVLLAAMIWGTTGTSQALAPSGASSMTIGALRLAVAGSVLMFLSFFRGGIDPAIFRQPLTAIMAAAMVAAYQLCFFAAVASTGVAVGTMVAIGSSPVLAGIAAFVINRERPSRTWLFATLLAVIGCILLFAPVGSGSSTASSTGIMLAIAAGSSYVAYTMLIKKLLRTAKSDAVITAVFSLGGVMLLPALFGKDLAWVVQPRGLVVVLHLGLIATVLAYMLFARGLKTVPASHAVTLSLAEPLTAALLGLTLLKEQVTSSTLCGIALVFGGLAVLGVGSRRVSGS